MIADDTRHRRPRISDEEHELWRVVTRSIAPLKRRECAPAAKSTKTTALLPSAPAAVVRGASSAAKKAVPKQLPKALSKSGSRQAESQAPHLVPLDRRLKQRLGRGTHPIDARLDLHGQTQERAHMSLLRFLRTAQASGAKTVLVITGKGAPNAAISERGVLRRMVPHWLGLAEFRAVVVGIAEAPIRHGGAGALIVRLRRARGDD